MVAYRAISEIKANTNPLIKSTIDNMTFIDELMPFIMENSVLTDRISVKGEREVSTNGASVVGCNDTITASAMSGAAYAYDLEAVVKDFEVCLIAEADGLAQEADRNVKVAVRDIAELVSQLAVADIEAQTTNIISGGAGAFTLADLDTLYTSVKNKGRGTFAYFGSPTAVAQLIAAMRTSLGGITYTEVAGLNLPMYRGAPILTTEKATAKTITAIDFGSFQGYFNKLPVGNEVAPMISVIDVGHSDSTIKRKWRLGTLFASVVLSTRNVARIYRD